MDFFEKTHIDWPKNHSFVQKITDTKLGKCFYYLPYLGICTSQNVPLNMYCNFANELLCLSELLYRNDMDLFAFLTVIWRFCSNQVSISSVFL